MRRSGPQRVSLQERTQLVEREPGPARVDHPVAVGAQQRQVLEPGPLARPQRVDGPRVVALDEPLTVLTVADQEVEPAHLAWQPAEAGQGLLLASPDEIA